MAVETFADKVPAIDSVNDVVQSIVRPAAGGLLFVSAAGLEGVLHPAVGVIAGVLVAGSVHAAKATARPVVNASTGGAGSPVVSLVEDVTAFTLTVLALVAPLLAVAVVVSLVVYVLRRRRALHE